VKIYVGGFFEKSIKKIQVSLTWQ